MTNLSEHQHRAYHSIRRQLLAGRLRTRKDLSRRKLAAELGVSPGCVQSVLGQLEAEKLLVSRPQSGTYLRQIDIEEYHQLFDLRMLIEPYAAGRAARWITAGQLERLEQTCAEAGRIRRAMGDDADPAVPVELLEQSCRMEHQFHGTILEAARNPTAAHFLENLRILHHYTLFFAQLRPREVLLHRAGNTEAEHRAVFDALCAHDAAAAKRLMRLHLRRGRFRLRQVLTEIREATDRVAPLSSE
jgi:DNA-binding GntR family transcriptional regulator